MAEISPQRSLTVILDGVKMMALAGVDVSQKRRYRFLQ